MVVSVSVLRACCLSEWVCLCVCACVWVSGCENETGDGRLVSIELHFLFYFLTILEIVSVYSIEFSIYKIVGLCMKMQSRLASLS